MSLKSRIENLESKIVDETTGATRAIFFTTADHRKDGLPPGPVLGWTYHGHEIHRADGESDTDLQGRAIVEIQQFLRPMEVPTFFAIQEETE
ncbi:MAG: hypothetical protein WA081_09805 [Desulfosalsimonadaceae bacterium]